MDCEYDNVCPELFLYGNSKAFPPSSRSGSWAISDEFQLLKDNATGEFVRVYNMPVYYSMKTWPANIIFFGGHRWVLTSEYDLFNYTAAKENNPDNYYF